MNENNEIRMRPFSVVILITIGVLIGIWIPESLRLTVSFVCIGISIIGFLTKG